MIAAFKWFALLPLWLARSVGLALGWLVWGISAKYRRMMRTNWDHACRSGVLGPSWAPQSSGARKTLRDAIGHAGLIAAELPKIWCDARVMEHVQAVGYEQVREIAQAGRGIIFLTPHLGAFELSSRWYALRAPITVLYRPSRHAVFRRVMERLRPMPQMATAPANASGVRALIRALRKGEAVGMLPDQVPSLGDGVWAPFFGAQAYTMVLPLRLAQASGAAIVWALTVRTPQGWRIELTPWRDAPSLDAVSAQDAASAMNAALELQIGRAPEQYLWAYNRYKTPRSAAPMGRPRMDNDRP